MIIKNAARKEEEMGHIYNQPAGRLVPSSDYKHISICIGVFDY